MVALSKMPCLSRVRQITVIVAVLLAGCRASSPSEPSAPIPLVLQVHYRTALGPVNVGNSFSLAAYVFDSDGAYEDVTSTATWSSMNPAAVQLTTPPSRFTAVAPGLADVSVTYRGLVHAVPVTVIEIDRQFPILSVTPGDPHNSGKTSPTSAVLRTSVTQSQNVTAQANWSSSDPRVVTVTPGAQTAMLTGVGPGTAWITASFNGLSTSYGLSIEP
jgi:hypothetical protein